MCCTSQHDWRADRVAPMTSSSRAHCDGARMSQPRSQLPKTPSAPYIHSNGQAPRWFSMKANLTSIPLRSRWLLFQDVTLHLQLCHFASKTIDLQLFWPHLAVPGECVSRIGGALLHPMRSTFSYTPRSRPACATAAPRSQRNLTTSSLNSRLSILRCIAGLR
jgi:hypothetical protein